MAFLDNSGDIILDAVLTDTGRFRLAKGDGSFKITKFAFGDDEIDYGLYNKNHASGSAYYDLAILQTPVLEAFTNNTSMMKSKLVSIARTNLLYLPVIKINEVYANKAEDSALSSPEGALVVAVDTITENLLKAQAGVALGTGQTNNGSAGTYIRLDQGLDTFEISQKFNLDSDLIENQYIIELDSRLGRISDKTNTNILEESFIDDDQVATYFVSSGDTAFVRTNNSQEPLRDLPQEGQNVFEVIAGPRGTILEFSIRASVDLNSSTYLFEKLGTTTAPSVAGKSATSPALSPALASWAYIDTTVRVTGATTGYRIDVPVRFVKAIKA
jgi:hypothetical protein